MGEGMIISANGGDFPLGGLQERLGEPIPLFELGVSPRAAKTGSAEAGRHHLQYATSRQFLQTVHSWSGG